MAAGSLTEQRLSGSRYASCPRGDGATGSSFREAYPGFIYGVACGVLRLLHRATGGVLGLALLAPSRHWPPPAPDSSHLQRHLWLDPPPDSTAPKRLWSDLPLLSHLSLAYSGMGSLHDDHALKLGRVNEHAPADIQRTPERESLRRYALLRTHRSFRRYRHRRRGRQAYPWLSRGSFRLSPVALSAASPAHPGVAIASGVGHVVRKRGIAVSLPDIRHPATCVPSRPRYSRRLRQISVASHPRLLKPCPRRRPWRCWRCL